MYFLDWFNFIKPQEKYYEISLTMTKQFISF